MQRHRRVGQLARGVGPDVGRARDGACPFRRRSLPVSRALLELRQLDRQRSVPAERPSAGEEGVPGLSPHASIGEREAPLAIRRLALRGARRPAAGRPPPPLPPTLRPGPPPSRPAPRPLVALTG